MSTDGGAGLREAAPPLPASIWVVAWASLAGQAVLLVQHGVRPDDGTPLVVSAAIGALLVGFVSAGVVRARSVRSVIAWIVLVLSLLAELARLVSVDGAGQALLAVASLATTAVALGALTRFRRTDWYAWQRTKPSPDLGPSIGSLVAIGVLVGILGGVIGSVDDGVEVRIDAAGR